MSWSETPAEMFRANCERKAQQMATAMTTSELKIAIDSLRYDISKLNTWNVRSPNDIEYYDEVLAQLSQRLQNGIWTYNSYICTNRGLYLSLSNGVYNLAVKNKKKKEVESWNAADFIFHVDK